MISVEQLQELASEIVGGRVHVSLDAPPGTWGQAAGGRYLRLSSDMFRGGATWREAAQVFLHELAHLVLGHGPQVRDSSAWNRQEREADELADKMYAAAGPVWFMQAAAGEATRGTRARTVLAIRDVLPRTAKLAALDRETKELDERIEEVERLRGKLPPKEWKRRVDDVNRRIKLYSLGD